MAGLDQETVAIIRAIKETNLKLSDKPCLLTENLTVSASAQALPFTGINSGDVGGVIIKVRKGAGTPTDSTYLIRYTQNTLLTPTASVGMWMGDGDLFEINNNANVLAFKVISTDATFAQLTIEYYGK